MNRLGSEISIVSIRYLDMCSALSLLSCLGRCHLMDQDLSYVGSQWQRHKPVLFQLMGGSYLRE